MPFNYEHFINEISCLVNEAKKFSFEDAKWDSEKFRNWRHKTLDSIYRIQKLKYSINCNIGSRQFHIFGYGNFSKAQQNEIFFHNLTDTINELELIIEQFLKYGDPIVKEPIPSELKEPNIEIVPPSKITLRWLIDHMEIKGWITILSIIAISFGFGYKLQSIISSINHTNPNSMTGTLEKRIPTH